MGAAPGDSAAGAEGCAGPAAVWHWAMAEDVPFLPARVVFTAQASAGATMRDAGSDIIMAAGITAEAFTAHFTMADSDLALE